MMDYIAPRPLAVIKLILRQNSLDARFVPIDRHMQRWSVSHSGGRLPGEVKSVPWDDSPPASKFRLPPLSDEETLLTDEVVRQAPPAWQSFIGAWYQSNLPVDLIAKDMGLKRRELYHERKLVLAYLLGHLTAAGVRLTS